MRMLAVDGNSILNRAFYGVRLLTNKKGMYTNAIFGFLNILLKLEKDYPSELAVITFDLKAPTFRHLQYDGYKANRKGMPEELAVQMKPLKELLAALGYPIIEQSGFEADDLLGTLSSECSAQKINCVVATGDRDSLQLINEYANVCLVKTKENLHCDIAQIKADYGIAPIQIIDLKALMGDASDNIPGVKGVGEKTALNLIQKYQTIENIYENLDELDVTPRVKKLLAQDKDNAFMSKELATICLTAPIGRDVTGFVKSSIDETAVAAMLTELEMFSFFSKLGVKSVGKLADNAQDEQGKSDVDVGLNAKEFEIIRNPTALFISKKLAAMGKIDFLMLDKLYIILDKDIVEVSENPIDILTEIILKSPLPKRSYMIKPLFKFARDGNFEITNLNFDLELAAYLLSATTKGYTLETLAQKYLQQNVYRLAKEDEHMEAIAAFPDLCDVLESEIKAQNMVSLLNDIELPLCEVLSDMEYEGFEIDLDGIKKYSEVLLTQIDELRRNMFECAGHEFNPNSTKELAVILFDELGLPPKTKTKTGFSTNVEVLESLLGKHPIIDYLLEYRKLAKLHSTYIVGLQKVVCDDGRVHSTFNQTETRTGRISSTEPNVQNIPVRTEQGSKIREFFVARDGYVLVDADYSQIELRILAHIADDKNMQKAFLEGVDIHQMTASEVFKLPLDEVPHQMRNRAKAINFGIVYGIGAYSLSQDINVPVYEAKEYIEEYLKTYSGVRDYMEKVVEEAKKTGYVETVYHRRRELSDINSSNKMVANNAKRIALNTPIQGTAADIIKIAMIKVYHRLKKEQLDARLILQVHDELIIEAPALQAQMVSNLLKQEMQQAAKLSVELLVDVNTGKNWLQAKG